MALKSTKVDVDVDVHAREVLSIVLVFVFLLESKALYCCRFFHVIRNEISAWTVDIVVFLESSRITHTGEERCVTTLKTALKVGILKFVKYSSARESSPHFPPPATFLARGNFHSRLDVSFAQLSLRQNGDYSWPGYWKWKGP